MAYDEYGNWTTEGGGSLSPDPAGSAVQTQPAAIDTGLNAPTQPVRDPGGFAPTMPSGGLYSPTDQRAVSGDTSGYEQKLQQSLGSLYDPTIYQDFVRNTSNNGGGDPNDWFNRIVAKNELRSSNEPNSQYVPNGQGGYTVGPTGTINRPPTGAGGAVGGTGAGGTFGAGLHYPGFQFNDPYTNLLEQISKNQITSLTGPNPQRQQLMDFLNKQFADLSTSQGYTPDELAVLRTQAMEPIEAQRQAAQQRELYRTSRAGYLPTSGITLDQQRQIDTSSDQARTAAQRDLAINAINQQNAKRQQAIGIGTQALQLPQQQNAEALRVAQGLYQLPRNAMQDALGVINPSNPLGAISPLIQLQQNAYNQQLQNQNQQADYWNQIGGWLNQILG